MPILSKNLSDVPLDTISTADSILAGEVFIGACRDTRVAWQKTNLGAMLRPERVVELREAYSSGDHQTISDFMLRIAVNPMASAAGNMGLNDKGAMRLSGLMLSAFLEPFVRSRGDGGLIDLCALRTALKEWIVSSKLPLGEGDDSNIGQITRLIDGYEQRAFLAASFASPIQFSVMALSLEDFL